jgi:hypothetical protein
MKRSMHDLPVINDPWPDGVPYNSAFKTDFELLASLIERANKDHDGHLTIMKFTTNWRVGFLTPNDRWEIKCLAGRGSSVDKSHDEAVRLMEADGVLRTD